MKKSLLLMPVLLGLPKVAFAHCPLCTVGAGVLAVFAASIGVSPIVVGILLGAFALALSLWIARSIKRQHIPQQEHVLTILIFAATIIPIMPLIVKYAPLYVPFIGPYGTTFTIDLFVLGVILGTLIMYVSPFVSKLVTKLRAKQIPFQGVSITLLLLVFASVIVQILS